MKKLFIIAFVLLSVVLSGCNRETEISGTERTAILLFADPAVDAIVNGINDNDYSLFSKSFDEQMKNTLNEKVFNRTRELIISKTGKYKSRNLSKVIKKDQFYIVYYNGKFEREINVEIKVVFQKSGTNNFVSGLWFNSPGLRK